MTEVKKPTTPPAKKAPAKKAAPTKGPVKVKNKKGETFEVSLAYFDDHKHELDLA